MPAFSIPLSGLAAESTALSAIANNLANLNTVGYKDARTLFRDLFYQNLGTTGAGDPIQLGSGVAVGSLQTNFTGNNVESTGVKTHVAISGDGFFVVGKNGNYQYTRAGNFHVGDDGLLTTEGGQYVMGYPAINGTVSTEALSPLQLGSGQMSPAVATTKIQLKANLDATAEVGSTAGSFSSPVNVYDSLGGSHILNATFTKTAANDWNYQITIPTSDLNTTPPADGTSLPANTVVASGSLSFDGNGKLLSQTGSDGTSYFSIDETGNPVISPASISITGLKSGASDLNIEWDIANPQAWSAGGTNSAMIGQIASESEATPDPNGYGAGSLLDFAIGQDGRIEGSFSNGTSMVLGQMCLANFANTQGLSRSGDSNFAATLASGSASYGVPESGGRGSLAGGFLEMSNVDIASEFAAMITAQRGFQANARAVTTFDDIAQETINLKRE